MKFAALLSRSLVLSLLVGALSVGCGKSSGDASGAASSAQPAAAAEAPTGRIVDIKVTAEKGFEPSTIEAKKGEIVSLRFTRTTESDCLKAIAIPSLNVKKDLPLNQAVVVNVPADKEGKIVFQCWMAMVKGEIDVKG